MFPLSSYSMSPRLTVDPLGSKDRVHYFHAVFQTRKHTPAVVIGLDSVGVVMS